MAGYAVEMLIEPGAETLLKTMGKPMRLKARSKIYDRIVSHIRQNFHISEITSWFSEDCFAPSRRTTVRLSAQNAQYLEAIAGLLGQSRPNIMLKMVYFAGVKLTRSDLESL